jgi:Ran GTPase-activating protein (RanGAP) involved in mRNA processing and transport
MSSRLELPLRQSSDVVADGDAADGVTEALELYHEQHRDCRRLRLSDSNLEETHVAELERIVHENARHVRLESLELSNAGLTTATSAALGRILTTVDETLQELDLSNNPVKAEGLERIVHALLHQSTSRLRKLDLSNNRFGPKGIRHVASLLRNHPTLQDLRLSRNALRSKGGVKTLVEACRDNLHLRFLDLSHNQLDDARVVQVAELLDHPRVASCPLMALDLSNNGFHARGMWELGGALVSGNNTTLRRLDVSGNNLGAEGGEALGTLLKLSYSLEDLVASNCNLGDAGVTDLCRGLARPETGTALRYLDVAWNVLHDEAAAALAELLEANSTLQVLKLECNGIGDHGAAMLARALPRAAALELFDLTGNQLHDAGAVALAVALTDGRCSRLELYCDKNAHVTDLGRNRIRGALQLRVSRMKWLNDLLLEIEGSSLNFRQLDLKLGDDELVEICKQVAVGKKDLVRHLPVVRLRGDMITVRGVKAVANQLLCSPTVHVKRLYLAHTRMGDEGANLLAHALLQNTSLTVLTLLDCQIADDGATYLSRALPRHQELQRLDLRKNHIGPEGGQLLLQAATEEAPSLRALLLASNMLDDSTVRSLTTTGHLETLSLADNGLTDAAALDLARICGATPSAIIWLTVSQNYMTERGIKALDLFLPALCSLEARPQKEESAV